jgi:hypothetical protein
MRGGEAGRPGRPGDPHIHHVRQDVDVDRDVDIDRDIDVHGGDWDDDDEWGAAIVGGIVGAGINEMLDDD